MAMVPRIFQLIYCSEATAPFSSEDLVALLQKSRLSNAPLALSGLLLYANGCFLQVLEGEESLVESKMRRIAKDSRHHKIVYLQRKFVPQRSFQDWSMGFRDLSTEAGIDGLSSFLDLPFDAAWRPEVAAHARILLEGFRRDHR
jgi:hypothetical protein